MIQKAAEIFKKRRGSLYCRDIKKDTGVRPLKSCIDCISEAAAILDDMFKNKDQ